MCKNSNMASSSGFCFRSPIYCFISLAVSLAKLPLRSPITDWSLGSHWGGGSQNPSIIPSLENGSTSFVEAWDEPDEGVVITSMPGLPSCTIWHPILLLKVLYEVPMGWNTSGDCCGMLLVNWGHWGWLGGSNCGIWNPFDYFPNGSCFLPSLVKTEHAGLSPLGSGIPAARLGNPWRWVRTFAINARGAWLALIGSSHPSHRIQHLVCQSKSSVPGNSADIWSSCWTGNKGFYWQEHISSNNNIWHLRCIMIMVSNCWSSKFSHTLVWQVPSLLISKLLHDCDLQVVHSVIVMQNMGITCYLDKFQIWYLLDLQFSWHFSGFC